MQGELAPSMLPIALRKQKEAEAGTECRKIKLLEIRCMCREMWTEEVSPRAGKGSRP